MKEQTRVKKKHPAVKKALLPPIPEQISHNKDKTLCPMCGGSKLLPQGLVDNYEFRSCSNCEFVFCPEITPEYLSQLYSEGFHGPQDGGPKRGWKKDLSFLEPAFRFLPRDTGLAILDFGTGQDRTPDVLREQGHRVIAVDIAPPLRPHVDRLTGNLLHLELESNQFDLVYSFQVFEHLPQPVPVLNELIRLTRPGGYILIHTDMETPEREREGFSNWWYASPPDHCAFFKIRTFEVYLANSPHNLVWNDEKSAIIRKG